VYAGKGQNYGRGLGCSVVMYLTSLYLNNGWTIIADNFYTSLNLANALLENKTHLLGTLRCNSCTPRVHRIKTTTRTNNR